MTFQHIEKKIDGREVFCATVVSLTAGFDGLLAVDEWTALRWKQNVIFLNCGTSLKFNFIIFLRLLHITE